MPTYSERPVQQATIIRSGGAVTFESLRNATTGNYILTGKATRALAGVSTATLQNTFSVLQRGIYTFDTSSIPVNATITSGILIITPTSVEKTLAGGKVGITGCSPTDPRSLAKSDYSKFSDTLLSDSLITDPTGGNLTFELNAAGLSNIVPGSDTTFMLRVHWDINGVFNGTWGNGVQYTVKGTVLDPSTPDALLVVEYAVESGAINELEGASTGIANSSGALSKNTSLSGSVSDTTSLSGVLSKNTPLSGSVVAATSFSGVLSKYTSLSGSVSDITSLSGGATIVLPIVAVIEPVSTASGTVLKDIRISGIVASVVNITSQIGAILPIGCTLSSVSTTAGALTCQRTVAGTVVGLAGTGAEAILEAPLYGNWPLSLTYQVNNAPTDGAIQIRHVFEWQPGMASDFSDIRFSDGLETRIPYWVQEYTAGVSAVVWVLIQANQASIKLHYGNETATSESNGDAVFILFDDFEGETLDSEKWTVEIRGVNNGGNVALDGAGAVAIDSGTGTYTSVTLLSQQTFGKGVVVEYRDKLSNTYYAMLSVGNGGLQDAQGTQANWHYTFLAKAYAIGCNDLAATGQTYLCRINPAANWTNLQTGGPVYAGADIYGVRRFEWRDNNEVAFYENDVLKLGPVVDSTYQAEAAFGLALTQGHSDFISTAPSIRTVDWVLVRKYAEVEPTLTIQEVIGEATIAAQSACSGDLSVTLSVGLSGEVSPVSEISGNLAAVVPVSGISVAISGSSGELTVDTALELTGSVQAVTICSGTAIRDLSLTCTVSTRAVQVSGSLARAIPVSGNISVASNFYTVLDQHSSFYGLVTTNSTIAGRLAVRSVRTAEACARPAVAALIRQVKGGREIEARVGRLSGTTQVARAQVLAATGYLQKITGIAKVSFKVEYKRFLVIEIDLDFVTMELDLDFKVVELRS